MTWLREPRDGPPTPAHEAQDVSLGGDRMCSAPGTEPAIDDSLTVAMALVPGLMSRNKLPALYEQRADVRRARARAALIRGIVRQLTGRDGPVEALTLDRGERAEERYVLRYRIGAMRLERRTLLSPLEASCLAHLATRAGATCLLASEEDEARVRTALTVLSQTLGLPHTSDQTTN